MKDNDRRKMIDTLQIDKFGDVAPKAKASGVN